MSARKALAVVVVVIAGLGIASAAWFLSRGSASFLRRSSVGAPALPGTTGREPARAGTPPWTAEEAAAIRQATRAGYRPASGADSSPSPERKDMVVLYGSYQPYFVRGDLNGDGRLDFAQAFVREKEGKLLFDVLVFFGGDGGRFSAPVPVETGSLLSAGDLAIDRTILIVTPDLSVDESVRYRFDSETGKFVGVDTEPADLDDDGPDPTPDDRPRARV